MTPKEHREREARYVLNVCERKGSHKHIGSFLIWRLLVFRRLTRRQVATVMGLTRQEVVRAAVGFSLKHLGTSEDAKIGDMRAACEAAKKSRVHQALRRAA